MSPALIPKTEIQANKTGNDEWNQNYSDTNLQRMWSTFRNNNSALWYSFVCIEALMLAMSLNDKKATKSRNILLVGVIAYALASSARFTLAQFIAYNHYNARKCSFYAKADRTLLIIGFGCLAMFLWLRQRVMYKFPQLKHLATKWVVWWSRFSLVLIIVATISGVGIVLGYWRSVYWVYHGKCVSSASGLASSALSGVVTSIAVHVSLLFLFVRFIALNRMRAGKKLPSNEKTTALVKRCCILTAVCIITDVVMLVVTTLIKGHVPEILTVLVLDLDQILNLSCVVLCFGQWKNSLLPWPCCSSIVARGHADVGNTSNNNNEFFSMRIFTISRPIITT
ncbi:uncharacterized protein LOC143464551 isoform X2 [Clavelina lepadiformis]|uniref:uncharacterized protein LOC143464551 isoform X2 n=1 Tax=Clavelina lepadiformis TaxID=159417 RepID=UPI0040419564